MSYSDIIGTAGVAMILLAYFLNVFSLIGKNSNLFFLLNIAGSAMACYASFLIIYIPFIVLEGAWCVVSVIGILTKSKKTN